MPGSRSCPAERQTLIAVLDDATKRLLYAQLWPGETTAAVMSALQAVFHHVRPAHRPLYRPRRVGLLHPHRRRPGRSDPPTQLGRALARLGIEHIPSYSPQGRGRGERLNRTLQGRLINELRRGGHHHRRGRQRLPARAVHRRLRRPVHLPAGRPGPGLRPAARRRPRPHPVPEEERTVGLDNVVDLRGRPPATRQAARPAHLRAACASPCAATSMAPTPSGAARSAWAATTPRPAPRGVYASAADRAARIAPRRRRSLPPPPPPSPHRLTRPRAALACPSAPGPERTDHLSKPSGHFTCRISVDVISPHRHDGVHRALAVPIRIRAGEPGLGAKGGRKM